MSGGCSGFVLMKGMETFDEATPISEICSKSREIIYSQHVLRSQMRAFSWKNFCFLIPRAEAEDSNQLASVEFSTSQRPNVQQSRFRNLLLFSISTDMDHVLASISPCGEFLSSYAYKPENTSINIPQTLQQSDMNSEHKTLEHYELCHEKFLSNRTKEYR
ncbi:hypothetical protein V6N11_015360 [Hibiscus sabdariffa]|uniref:Uncharacterized protein n=1 Tax=Hibiscus sabdariffa TaxID=183260 RepID=A0ABR2TRV0_9ROSI